MADDEILERLARRAYEAKERVLRLADAAEAGHEVSDEMCAEIDAVVKAAFDAGLAAAPISRAPRPGWVRRGDH